MALAHKCPSRVIFMDRLWRDFTPKSLFGFREQEHVRGPCISITHNTTLTEPIRSVPVHFNIEEEWKKWKADIESSAAIDTLQPQPSFSLLICPRRKPDPRFPLLNNDMWALSAFPASTDRFRDILTCMHVPDIFLDIMSEPKSIFRKLKGSSKRQECEVYMLCVDNTVDDYTAMCITYFPKSQQVFGLFLGYNSESDIAHFTSRLLMNESFIYNPFVLISAFLELEKAYRFVQTQSMINQLWEALDQHLMSPGKAKDSFAEKYGLVGILKTNLLVWISVLDNVLETCHELPNYHTQAKDGFMISPEEYIKILKRSYHQNVLWSETYLQTVSLDFQLAQADTAQRDAQTAINDAKQMKAIALLTMFFLPATAVAGFMDAPIYDWEGRGYFFWVITGPITIGVLFCYFVFILLSRREKGRDCILGDKATSHVLMSYHFTAAIDIVLDTTLEDACDATGRDRAVLTPKSGFSCILWSDSFATQVLRVEQSSTYQYLKLDFWLFGNDTKLEIYYLDFTSMAT